MIIFFYNASCCDSLSYRIEVVKDYYWQHYGIIVFLIFVAYQFLVHLSTTLADLVAQDYSDPNWVVAVSLLHVFDHDVKAIFSYSTIITPRVQLISIRTLELKSVIFSFFYSILKSITLRRIKRDYDNWLSIVKTIIHECQVFIVDLEKHHGLSNGKWDLPFANCHCITLFTRWAF